MAARPFAFSACMTAQAAILQTGRGCSLVLRSIVCGRVHAGLGPQKENVVELAQTLCCEFDKGPCLWEVEALDPCPPGYLGCVKEDGVLVCAGNRAVFQQLPPPHFGIDDLAPQHPYTVTWMSSSRLHV